MFPQGNVCSPIKLEKKKQKEFGWETMFVSSKFLLEVSQGNTTFCERTQSFVSFEYNFPSHLIVFFSINMFNYIANSYT